MTEFNLDPSQERAVELVCAADGPRLAIVTGGPGCGKTTSLRVALDRLEESGAIVRLAAPTGKAAKRMNEATGRATSTVHRLLEFYGQGFRRTARNPLDARLVVVDEASMLDVELAAALFAAVRGRTRLVLVGDADQLPSVGPGRVFADLIDGPLAHLPSSRFAANHAWALCAAMTHNLLRAAATLTDRQLATARGATLRRRIVNVPARIARPQRRGHQAAPPASASNQA